MSVCSCGSARPCDCAGPLGGRDPLAFPVLEAPSRPEAGTVTAKPQKLCGTLAWMGGGGGRGGGGRGLSWRAAPARRGHARLSVPTWPAAPGCQAPARATRRRPPARCPAAARPRSPPPLPPPHLGHTEQPRLSVGRPPPPPRPRLLGLRPPTGTRPAYLYLGQGGSARWSGWRTARRQDKG